MTAAVTTVLCQCVLCPFKDRELFIGAFSMGFTELDLTLSSGNTIYQYTSL